EAHVAVDTWVGLTTVESGVPHGQPSSLAAVPSLVTVKAGDTRAMFPIRTSEVAPRAHRTATIVARAVATKSAVLTVESAERRPACRRRPPTAWAVGTSRAPVAVVGTGGGGILSGRPPGATSRVRQARALRPKGGCEWGFAPTRSAPTATTSRTS